MLRTQNAVAYAQICGLRDGWRAHVRAGRWYEAFIDFYNGPDSFARWPSQRREAFLAVQQARGDLWDVLFDGPLTPDALSGVTAPVHVAEGSQTSAVDHAICDVVRRHVPQTRHTGNRRASRRSTSGRRPAPPGRPARRRRGARRGTRRWRACPRPAPDRPPGPGPGLPAGGRSAAPWPRPAAGRPDAR